MLFKLVGFTVFMRILLQRQDFAISANSFLHCFLQKYLVNVEFPNTVPIKR